MIAFRREKSAGSGGAVLRQVLVAAVLREQAGRGDGMEADVADRPHDQAGRGLVGDPQRQVERLPRQVDLAVRQVQVEDDLRIALPIAGQQAGEIAGGAPDGRGEPQRPARFFVALPQGGGGAVEGVERIAAVLEVDGARLGEADVPAAAVQQPGAHLPLEVGHVLARHGRRDVHALGCGGEAAAFRDMPEDPQAGQRVHRSALGWRRTDRFR